ncbi:MAG: response regulator [Candidatus Woesearchaeota archaeon]
MNDYKRILCIESNEDIAHAICIFLNGESFKVDHVERAKDALESKKKYDLMLVDSVLPEMKGVELISKIRSKKENERCKFGLMGILPVSCNEIEMMKKKGVDDYLKKPFTKEELLSFVNKLIS